MQTPARLTGGIHETRDLNGTVGVCRAGARLRLLLVAIGCAASVSGQTNATFSDRNGSVPGAEVGLEMLDALPALPQTFYIEPISQGVVEGESLWLRVYNTSVAIGAATLQWFFNGQPLSNATQQTLRIDNINAAHAGEYYAVASNAAGTMISRTAVVTVSPRGPLDAWSWRRPLPQGNELRAIACGEGALVAVGRGGARLVSTDAGVTWENHPGPMWTFRSLGFGHGQFLGFPDRWDPFSVRLPAVVHLSSNGVAWAERAVPELDGIWIDGLAFGGDRFVAVGSGARVAVSTNGWAWTVIQPTNFTVSMTRVTWANGQFLATASGSWAASVAASSDGLTWAHHPLPVPCLLNGVTWGDGRYVACGALGGRPSTNAVFLSSDLVTWTVYSLPVAARVTGLAAGGGQIVIVGEDPRGVVFTSSDGATWTHQFLTTGNEPYAVTHAFGQFVIVGECGNILTSTDGLSWTVRSGASDLSLRSIARGNGIYVAAGNAGLLFNSSNAVAWTAVPRPVTNHVRGVTFGAGRFIAVGEHDATGALVLVSTNGVQWTRLAPAGSNLFDVTYAQGRFVAVGDGNILVSFDGLSWTPSAREAAGRLNRVAWGGGSFIAVGQNATIVTSPDGLDWKLRWDTGDDLQGIAYGNGIYVAAGRSGCVLTATNLHAWERPPTALYRDVDAVFFGQGLFVAVGAGGLCATSPDGSLWTPHATACANDLHAVIVDEKGLTAVGDRETIIQSAPLNEMQPFVRREFVASVVQLTARPQADVSVYAVEEQLPPGVAATGISHDGFFDAVLRKVKFGPFLDNQPRVLSYALAYEHACGYDVCARSVFHGIGSADGIDTAILGATELLQVGLHPADLVAPLGAFAVGEVTSYSAAWRRSHWWSQGPHPIPMDYVTRAAALWRNSECYQVDERATNAPLCWIACPRDAAMPAGVSSARNGATAQRQMPAGYISGESLNVRIAITPVAAALAYAIEETPPAGWMVSGVSDGGEWDASAGTVKWGPYFDATPRLLAYSVVSPADAAGTALFAGNASTDGSSMPIAGAQQSQATARLRLEPRAGSGGLILRAQGAPQTYAIWVSTDLQHWTLLPAVVAPDQPFEVNPDGASAAQRFYRIEALPGTP